jgi:hypothetical protein
MSDPKTPEAVSEPPKPEAAPEHHPGRHGVKDSGEIVSTAGGELIDGRIADIADGDR